MKMHSLFLMTKKGMRKKNKFRIDAVTKNTAVVFSETKEKSSTATHLHVDRTLKSNKILRSLCCENCYLKLGEYSHI